MKKIHPALTAILLCVLYSGIFFLFSRPLYSDFHHSFISDFGDAPTFVWNLYHFTQACADHTNPFYTHALFYPIGTSLILHSYTPLFGALNSLLHDPVFTLNIGLLISFMFSGLGGYLLCRQFVPNPLLAFFCGFAFAFCPYKMSHLTSHFNLMLTATIPFYTLLMLQIFPGKNPGPFRFSKARLAGLIILFCITFACDYYYSYYLLVLTGAYLFYNTVKLQDRNLPVSRIIIGLIGIVLVSCGIIFFGERLNLPRTGFCYTFDLLNLITPAASSQFFGTAIVHHIRTTVIKGGPLENTVFFGWTIFALFIWALFSRQFKIKHPNQKLLVYFIAVFAIFAMPIISVAGKPLFALPTVILQYIPFVNNFRVPCRFSLLVMLFIPIYISLFLYTAILPKLSRLKQNMLIIVIIGLLGIEYFPKTYLMQSAMAVPKIYRTLATRPVGALLEIPFGIEGGFHELGRINYSQPLFQTIHHKPELGGYTSRISPSVIHFFNRFEISTRLLSMSRSGGGFTTIPTVLETSRFIKATRLRYIIIPPEYKEKPIGMFIMHTFYGFMENEETEDGYTLLTINNTYQ